MAAGTGGTVLDADIVVVGAGMVGAACATALLQAGFSTLLVERSMPPAVDLDAEPGLRVSAVSRASDCFLSHIGAWQRVIAARAAPYRRMAVWEHDDGAETLFDAAEIAELTLGHIAENALIQQACVSAYTDAGGEMLCPASVASVSLSAGGNAITLDDGRVVRCRLLIAADGARSAVRAMVGIDAPAYRYDQHALVATVETAFGQQDITWQRFKPSGPEALLPLAGARASLVWYHSPDRVTELGALSDADFLDALHDHFPSRLGRVERLIERGSFPLFRAHAERYVQTGVALIGDAAHSGHPLAGQGVNLGFMDAAALVDVLVDARTAGREIGNERVLRRYQRWRRGENAAMLAALHRIQQSFGSASPAIGVARSALLAAGQTIPPARRALCRHAMGLAGDLPRLARPAVATP